MGKILKHPTRLLVSKNVDQRIKSVDPRLGRLKRRGTLSRASGRGARIDYLFDWHKIDLKEMLASARLDISRFKNEKCLPMSFLLFRKVYLLFFFTSNYFTVFDRVFIFVCTTFRLYQKSFQRREKIMTKIG